MNIITRMVEYLRMPEFRVSIGKRNIPEISFDLLKGERMVDHRGAHAMVSVANSHIRDYKQASVRDGTRGKYKENAISALSTIISSNIAADFVTATLDEKVDSNVVFTMEEEGYIVVDTNIK